MTNEDIKKLAEELLTSQVSIHEEMCLEENCGCLETIVSALLKVRSETIEECAEILDEEEFYIFGGREYEPIYPEDKIRALKEEKKND